MAAKRCPHCDLLLTKSEAAKKKCPSCGIALSDRPVTSEGRAIVALAGVRGGRSVDVSSDPDPVDIGEVHTVFRPGYDNIIAGFVIALLLVSAGIAGIWYFGRQAAKLFGERPMWADKGPGWTCLLVLFSVLVIVGGVFLAFYVRSLSALRVAVGLHGFRVMDGRETNEFLWHKIAAVEESHLYERPPVLKGPAKYVLPELKSRSFCIEYVDGRVFEFNANSLKGHSQFADIVKESTRSRGILWRIVETHA